MLQFQILKFVRFVQTLREIKVLICVVEDIRTMIAIENTLQYKGKYHVLGGLFLH